MGLYISASGILNSIQRNDVHANNVANARTPGYRAARPNSTSTRTGGVRFSDVSRSTAQGPIEVTGRPLDAASGPGFFRVVQSDGSVAFTRDGSFGLNAQGEVVTSNGVRLDPAVLVPANATHVSVARNGTVYATTPDGVMHESGQLRVYRFANPDGLQALGGNLFAQTPASGEAVAVEPQNATHYSGALQGSNVNLTLEMIGQVLEARATAANADAFRAQGDMLGELFDLAG